MAARCYWTWNFCQKLEWLHMRTTSQWLTLPTPELTKSTKRIRLLGNWKDGQITLKLLARGVKNHKIWTSTATTSTVKLYRKSLQRVERHMCLTCMYLGITLNRILNFQPPIKADPVHDFKTNVSRIVLCVSSTNLIIIFMRATIPMVSYAFKIWRKSKSLSFGSLSPHLGPLWCRTHNSCIFFSTIQDRLNISWNHNRILAEILTRFYLVRERQVMH